MPTWRGRMTAKPEDDADYRPSVALDLMQRSPTARYSQLGEDGLLDAVFKALEVTRGRLVEVGAWDGVHLSNCRALLEAGWSGVHIEADEERAARLKENVAAFGSHAVCAQVGPTGTLLSQLLTDAGEPDHVNLLSIDIDSDDLAVLEDFAVSGRWADVVCVEYNQTVPNDVRFVNTPGRTWGNSALSLHEAATAAGYALVAYTERNLLFVADRVLGDRFVRHHLPGESGPGQHRTWWGYDGTLFVSTVEQARQQPQVQPAERLRPPWGQPSFAQPVPPERRTWPTEEGPEAMVDPTPAEQAVAPPADFALSGELESLRHELLVLSAEVSRNHGLLLDTQNRLRRLLEERLSFTEQGRALAFVAALRPHRLLDRRKVRIGSPHDGGYVVVDDWTDVVGVLSGGAGDNIDFELEAARRGAVVHLYDHTVPDLPGSDADLVAFHREPLGSIGTTLVEALERMPSDGDLLLKVDIDGGEWDLLSDSNVDLSRFRQVVFEFHDLHRLDDTVWFEAAIGAISRITATHAPVHVHANNFGAYAVLGGVPVPDIVEVTFVRRADYALAPSDVVEADIDAPNDPARPDIVWPV
jgi:hypothetical protein